jgi:hypothetical protein
MGGAASSDSGSADLKKVAGPLQLTRPVGTDTAAKAPDGRVNQPLTEVVFL